MNKTILTDEKGLVSLLRFLLVWVMVLISVTLGFGLIFTGIVILFEVEGYNDILIIIFTSVGFETLIGIVGKVIQKKFEGSNETIEMR